MSTFEFVCLFEMFFSFSKHRSRATSRLQRDKRLSPPSESQMTTSFGVSVQGSFCRNIAQVDSPQSIPSNLAQAQGPTVCRIERHFSHSPTSYYSPWSLQCTRCCHSRPCHMMSTGAGHWTRPPSAWVTRPRGGWCTLRSGRWGWTWPLRGPGRGCRPAPWRALAPTSSSDRGWPPAPAWGGRTWSWGWWRGWQRRRRHKRESCRGTSRGYWDACCKQSEQRQSPIFRPSGDGIVLACHHHLTPHCPHH